MQNEAEAMTTSDRPVGDFTLRYRFFLFLSLAYWIFGWWVLYAAFTQHDAFIKNSPGPWFDVIFWVAVVTTFGGAGPFGVLKYSLVVCVSGEELVVEKYLGLVRKTYHVGDVCKFNIGAGTKNMPVMNITFRNGDKLFVSAWAQNFQSLSDYLSSRVAVKT